LDLALPAGVTDTKAGAALPQPAHPVKSKHAVVRAVRLRHMGHPNRIGKGM
jgi:hypothetical protein